ncbi:MAG: hypothetical protein ABI969_04860 [bacterium]
MTLVRPSAVVTVDGKRLTSAEGAVMRVRVRLGMGPAHDSAEIFCWPSSKLKDAKVGAATTIALGTSGSEADVWTGEITGVRLTPDGVTLEGLASSIALSRTFTSQAFVSVSAADVVKQLAQAAGVDIDSATGDTALSFYAVDDRRSAWSHINDLARLIGADVTVTEAGKLKFVAPEAAAGGGIGAGIAGAAASAVSSILGGGAAGLRYGANVLEWRATSRAEPGTSGIAAYGAASESGSDKWHWLRHDLTAAGKGPVQSSAAMRTKDAATAAADALTARAKRATRRTTVSVVGDATLRPGQTTQVSGIPGDAGGDLRILSVEHVLDAGEGLLTRLTVELST